jgi:hypothetical protein
LEGFAEAGKRRRQAFALVANESRLCAKKIGDSRPKKTRKNRVMVRLLRALALFLFSFFVDFEANSESNRKTKEYVSTNVLRLIDWHHL